MESTPAPNSEPQVDPTRSLSRNALALILNTVATSVLGALFWVLAARFYEPAQLGRDSALVSAMMLLAVIAELDLGLALPRFLPQLGHRSARAVLTGYLVSSAAAVVLTALMVTVIPHVSKSLAFFGGSWPLALLLGASVVMWNIFAVQDAVLTALRRSSWIPIENGIFGVAKLLLMIAWAHTHIHHGVFVAWVVPMAVMIVPVNFALFRWAIPHHAQLTGGAQGVFWADGGRGRIVKYLAQDYVASLLIQGATTLIPILVLVLLGAETNAYFYVAFTVSTAIDQLGHNVGLSLTVESSFDETQLGRLTRHTFKRFGLLLGAAVTAVLIGAPVLLWFFGDDYSSKASTILRLLVLGCIPQTVLNLYQAVERVRGHGTRVLLITMARFGTTVSLVVVMAKTYGLAGVGWGWLLGSSLVMTLTVVPLYRVMRKG